MFLPVILLATRFTHIVRLGFKDRAFRVVTTILAFWVATGTTFYSIYEDWGVINSLYFTVVTLTTIGYGDFTPSTANSKLFTSIFAPMAIGSFVAFNARIVQITVSARVDKQEASPEATASSIDILPE